MSHQQPPPEDQPETGPQAPNPRAEVTPGRRTLWWVGGALGIYMIGRGVYDLVTEDEDEQP